MQSEIPDAFAAGLFLPARQAIPFDEVLVEYANSESLQPYLAPSTDDGDVLVHVDEDRHLLDNEARRLDDERLARDIARFHAARREASMLAMINIALPLGQSIELSDGQDYLLHVARDERGRLGTPDVRDLSRAAAAMRQLVCAKLDALIVDSVTVAADGDTLVYPDGTEAAVLGRLCPVCWYATRAALAQRAIDTAESPVLGQDLVDPTSVAVLYTLGLIEF
ncbi:hypothetical protein LT350_20265 [Mycolicibacterium smegmatis]|uniref:hypothetical protein n=1 Tax=Mycolicibacterium smegmatis TaxID=1772 RepID=UPI001E57D034|nr:hypothetical protein [Mycolicibacterium smegmatis]UGU28923.1 hypothetical protein LT350_20265 [Mycolicibacterium smegmatis]ULN69910.1 hypothetical protein KZ782_30800 [Mycolicibacterium smegmatis]